MIKKVLSILTAVLVLGTIVQAQVPVAVPTAAPEQTIVVPGITPVTSGIVNFTLNTLTAAPAAVSANVVSEAVTWNYMDTNHDESWQPLRLYSGHSIVARSFNGGRICTRYIF